MKNRKLVIDKNVDYFRDDVLVNPLLDPDTGKWVGWMRIGQEDLTQLLAVAPALRHAVAVFLARVRELEQRMLTAGKAPGASDYDRLTALVAEFYVALQDLKVDLRVDPQAVSDEAYRKAARRAYGNDRLAIGIDEEAEVMESEDRTGAWVQGWLWVRNIDIPKGDSDE